MTGHQPNKLHHSSLGEARKQFGNEGASPQDSSRPDSQIGKTDLTLAGGARTVLTLPEPPALVAAADSVADTAVSVSNDEPNQSGVAVLPTLDDLLVAAANGNVRKIFYGGSWEQKLQSVHVPAYRVLNAAEAMGLAGIGLLLNTPGVKKLKRKPSKKKLELLAIYAVAHPANQDERDTCSEHSNALKYARSVGISADALVEAMAGKTLAECKRALRQVKAAAQTAVGQGNAGPSGNHSDSKISTLKELLRRWIRKTKDNPAIGEASTIQFIIARNLYGQLEAALAEGSLGGLAANDDTQS